MQPQLQRRKFESFYILLIADGHLARLMLGMRGKSGVTIRPS